MGVSIWWDRQVEWKARDIIHCVKWLNSSLRTCTQSSAPTLKGKSVWWQVHSCHLRAWVVETWGCSYFINPSQWRNQSPKSGVWHLRKRTQLVLWSLHPHSCAYNYTEVHSNTRVCACACTHTHVYVHMHTHMGGEKYTELHCLTKVCLDILNICLHRICRHLC